MTRVGFALLLVVSSTACDREPGRNPGSEGATRDAPAAPSTPASEDPAGPRLTPQMATLERIAAQAPPALSDAESAELRELIESAYSDGADEDIASRAARRLENDARAPLALEAALSHDDAAIRTRCAYALATLGSESSVPALLLRLRVEQDRSAKLWMAGAILKLGIHCPPALDAVAANFEDPALSGDASMILNDVLAAAGSTLPPQAGWDDARAAFAKLRDFWVKEGYPLGSVPPAFERPEDLEPRLRAALAADLVQLSEFQLRPVDEARFVLKNLGVLALPLLHLALTASESYVRAHAVEIVRDIGPAAKSLEPAIVALLEDPLTRLTAIQAVGLIGARGASDRLRAFVSGDDLELACASASALGEIGDESSRDALRRMMNDESAAMDLRVYAAYGLARLDRSVDGGGEGAAFLRDAVARKTYHEPTLAELIANAGRP